jgi:mRNA interferase HigB
MVNPAFKAPSPYERMRIISEVRVHEYCKQYSDAADWLRSFLAVAREATWRHLQDVRVTYRHADAVVVSSGRIVTVLNVKGNRYRLILAIHYNTGCVFVLRFFPHAEYSKGNWKRQL